MEDSLFDTRPLLSRAITCTSFPKPTLPIACRVWGDQLLEISCSSHTAGTMAANLSMVRLYLSALLIMIFVCYPLFTRCFDELWQIDILLRATLVAGHHGEALRLPGTPHASTAPALRAANPCSCGCRGALRTCTEGTTAEQKRQHCLKAGNPCVLFSHAKLRERAFSTSTKTHNTSRTCFNSCLRARLKCYLSALLKAETPAGTPTHVAYQSKANLFSAVPGAGGRGRAAAAARTARRRS